MTKASQPLLLLFRSPPLANGRASAGIDLLLTAASFDRQVTPLFIGEGLGLLQANQSPSVASRNAATALGALELYGVNILLASARDAAARGIDLNSYELPVQAVSDEDIRDLLEQDCQVMVF